MRDPLLGPRLKLERAKHHINDLDKQSYNFFSQHWKVIVRDLPETGQRCLHLKADKPIPESMGLLIGDTAHNLRSCLDLLVWVFVSPHSPPNPDRVQFPYCRNAQSLTSAIKNRQIHLANPEVIRIISETKPYPGGDNDLVSLHRLSIADKHRILTPIASLAKFERFDIRRLDPAAPDVPGGLSYGFRGFENQNLVTWTPDPTSTAQMNNHDVDATFGIMFATGQPFAHDRVIPTLQKLTRKIEATINKFDGIVP